MGICRKVCIVAKGCLKAIVGGDGRGGRGVGGQVGGAGGGAGGAGGQTIDP